MTLWVFLTQVLDPDHSCRQAVARLLAYRSRRGLPPCAADPSASCKARRRLPEGILARLTRDTGRRPLDQASPGWLWKGRRVKVVDGTTVSMPDTPQNQAAFPQAPTQQTGLGFLIARLVVVFSLASRHQLLRRTRQNNSHAENPYNANLPEEEVAKCN